VIKAEALGRDTMDFLMEIDDEKADTKTEGVVWESLNYKRNQKGVK